MDINPSQIQNGHCVPYWNFYLVMESTHEGFLLTKIWLSNSVPIKSVVSNIMQFKYLSNITQNTYSQLENFGLGQWDPAHYWDNQNALSFTKLPVLHIGIAHWSYLLTNLLVGTRQWQQYTRSSATAEKQRVSCEYMRSWRAVSLR